MRDSREVHESQYCCSSPVSCPLVDILNTWLLEERQKAWPGLPYRTRGQLVSLAGEYQQQKSYCCSATGHKMLGVNHGSVVPWKEGLLYWEQGHRRTGMIGNISLPTGGTSQNTMFWSGNYSFNILQTGNSAKKDLCVLCVTVDVSNNTTLSD